MRGQGPRLDGEVLQALEALKNACKEIQANPWDATAGGGCNSPSMKALLELESGSDDLLSGDPHLSTLSHLLSRLKSLSSSLCDRRIRSFLRRRSGDHELARVAGSIGSEIQSWIDRETVDRLVSALNSPSVPPDGGDDRAATLLALIDRVSRGFDPRLQDVLLRSGAFAAVEAALGDPAASKLVRDRSAAAAAALVRFNKNVFVEPVLMGTTVRSLVSMASTSALLALNGLIPAIRSPIVDEIFSHGEIPRIVGLLAAGDVELRALALDSVMEIGYHGRKEAIDAMLDEGLVERLMELQRSELGGALIDMEDGGGGGGGVEAGEVRRERRWLEARPFASCVARVAIQVEVGEGLRQREKRAFKAEVVRRVRAAAAAADGAEAATVLAEVLWGSTP